MRIAEAASVSDGLFVLVSVYLFVQGLLGCILHVIMFASCCTCVQGRGHRFIRRLSDWCFEYKEMFLNADGYPHVVDHPAALHLALAQLCRELQAAGTSTLSLSGWQWDADMLRGYVQALPRLAERGVVSHSLEMNIGVTQELLGMLLQVCAMLAHLARLAHSWLEYAYWQ